MLVWRADAFLWKDATHSSQRKEADGWGLGAGLQCSQSLMSLGCVTHLFSGALNFKGCLRTEVER